ncbi:MAG: hypothetical protein COB40_13575 [Marinosulfonomonas sp.]|nr:MAG: hypothetical protein COB40_13575 [Marinosulfonomonas sp.]
MNRIALPNWLLLIAFPHGSNQASARCQVCFRSFLEFDRIVSHGCTTAKLFLRVFACFVQLDCVIIEGLNFIHG